MKNKIKLILVTALLSVMGLADVKAQTDVTNTYITNSGFEDCTAATADVTTTGKVNCTDYEANGWKNVNFTSGSGWSTSAVFEYGSGYKNNGAAVPATDKNGNTGKTLGVSVGRKTTIYYQSANTVTLPAGRYTLSVDVINANTSSSQPYLSRVGFTTTSSVSYLSTKSSVSTSWETESVTFTLYSATEGRFQVGQASDADQSSGTYVKAFYDNLKLTREDLTPKEQLKGVIDEATLITLPTENIGTGLFQYSQTRLDALTSALSAANTTYNNGSATESDYNSARTALESAMAEYDILNAPAADKRYRFFYHKDGKGWDGYAVTMYKGVNTDQGNYGAKYLTSTANADYGQAFVLTATATKNCYTFSFTTDEGTTRYLCDGRVYAGADYWVDRRIRTTDDASKALAIEIQYTKTVSGTPHYTLINTTAPEGIGENGNNNMYSLNPATFTFEEASKASVSVAALAAGKYATRIFPFKPEKVSGVTYYSCDAVDGTTLTLTEVGGDLTANTPYLLYAPDATSAETLEGWGTAQQNNYSAGLLIGTYASSGYVPENSYVLQTQNSRQAFYQADANSITLVPYRAYLTAQNNNARAFLFPEYDVTAINMFSNEESAQIESIYQVNGTTSGRLVKGLNIVKMSDGSVKKIYVK